MKKTIVKHKKRVALAAAAMMLTWARNAQTVEEIYHDTIRRHTHA